MWESGCPISWEILSSPGSDCDKVRDRGERAERERAGESGIGESGKGESGNEMGLRGPSALDLGVAKEAEEAEELFE